MNCTPAGTMESKAKVMRVDMLDTTPPGATVAQTTVARAFGKLLQGMSCWGLTPVVKLCSSVWYGLCELNLHRPC